MPPQGVSAWARAERIREIFTGGPACPARPGADAGAHASPSACRPARRDQQRLRAQSAARRDRLHARAPPVVDLPLRARPWRGSAGLAGALAGRRHHRAHREPGHRQGGAGGARAGGRRQLGAPGARPAVGRDRRRRHRAPGPRPPARAWLPALRLLRRCALPVVDLAAGGLHRRPARTRPRLRRLPHPPQGGARPRTGPPRAVDRRPAQAGRGDGLLRPARPSGPRRLPRGGDRRARRGGGGRRGRR